MNGGFVVDASVGISWAVLSQSNEDADQLSANVAAGLACLVPGLWALEVASVLLTLVRRRRITSEEYADALHKLKGIAPVIDEEAPGIALTTLSRLAAKHDLSVYDAAYLELALRKQLPLASRDAALNRAARRSGVKTLL